MIGYSDHQCDLLIKSESDILKICQNCLTVKVPDQCYDIGVECQCHIKVFLQLVTRMSLVDRGSSYYRKMIAYDVLNKIMVLDC